MKAGIIFSVTHPKWPDCIYTYQVIKLGLNEGQGQVMLSKLKEVDLINGIDVEFKLNQKTITVDRLWFNSELTKRKFKICQ